MLNHAIIYIIGIWLLVVSCNPVFDEESLSQEIPVPISFNISESYLSTRGVVNSIDGTNISSVGIYGVQEGTTSGQFPWTSTPFAANLVPSGVSQGNLSFTSKMYYPTGGKKVAFYAYYPRTANTATTLNSYITPPGNGTAPTYNFTISDQQDVMHAVATPMNSSSGNGVPVALKYNHKLCQIIINTSALLNLQSMKILAVSTKGSMNLETGAITWSSNTAPITINAPLLLGGNSDPVLVPANVPSYQFQVTLLILSKTYTIAPSSGGFVPGVAYTISF